MVQVSDRSGEIFSRHDARMTMGGEPTFVPLVPEGPEWNYSAVGPTKLGYAQSMARRLLARELKGGVDFFCPGKSYPGEVNPRWAIRLLANRDGSAIFRPRAKAVPTVKSVAAFRRILLRELGLGDDWELLRDPLVRSNRVWALVLDGEEGAWKSFAWPKGKHSLSAAEGPAGLRLPLHVLPARAPRRALTLEWRADRIAIFMPPVMQIPFLELLGAVEQALFESGIGRVEMQGYMPADDAGQWIQLGLTADPGVLEVNLPACADWREYDFWIRTVTAAAESCGLRSWKQLPGGHPEGTGGGNHLLWGGPSVEENPFFTRPGWLASILRYWQSHPSLAYLFTGCYVGASSQAPRADESARDRHDLEMAWTFLESLGPGDHRVLISETLRHLQTDVTGNAHRSEISLDKFWNVGWPAGTLGLIEFRAIESLPRADWMSAAALLWSTLAAWLLDRPFRKPLRDFTNDLHDTFFLPSVLWADLAEVLSDLEKAGFAFDKEMFRSIWDWKFPVMLDYRTGPLHLTVRRAHEGWPLLCETPVDGGTTSRFVDTSMQRMEICANDELAAKSEIRVDNRPLPLRKSADGTFLGGLRFRRTNLYPSLHPGLPPQLPIEISIVTGGKAKKFSLGLDDLAFHSAGTSRAPDPGTPCQTGRRSDLTCDLRIV